MRIGELARRTGVSERSLRYYEEQGLLHPRRRPSGYRVFQESDVDTVRHVRVLLSAGLGTATIAEVLPCMVDTGDGLAPGCPELVAELNRERERITSAITGLTSARTLLDQVIAAAPADDAAYGEWVAAHA
ncbi:MerR family transcriptional regulator [Actinophytocola xanthii]|uniref:MerR family transcriptional regulator n=1 Tax=Actinophytocola xanthii TaxID=1912961 RepID=A0A1Q8CUC9_9PSEU|nr:MerR family transcriptional regulator [Actinophytocola xanthii]OLF17956.1 MerR family transcriptional regulator [Actinophytocola xanthii]